MLLATKELPGPTGLDYLEIERVFRVEIGAGRFFILTTDAEMTTGRALAMVGQVTPAPAGIETTARPAGGWSEGGDHGPS